MVASGAALRIGNLSSFAFFATFCSNFLQTFCDIRVPVRPAQHVHRRVPDLPRRTRLSATTIIEGGTPDMTIGRVDADQTRERVPTLA
jgi:hypothetical protein